MDGTLVGAGSLWRHSFVSSLSSCQISKDKKKKLKNETSLDSSIMKFQIDSQKYRRMHKLFFKAFTFIIAIFGLSFLWMIATFLRCITKSKEITLP
jgi:hypothetical protein